MRVSVSTVALTLILSGSAWLPAGAQAPQTYHGPIWEHGVLESVWDKEGWGLTFCRTTPDGCVETVLESGRPTASGAFPSRRAEDRRGTFDAAYARAIGKLGREGWELVAEGVTGARCDTCRVLYFKRLAGTL
jgi:hypothetical protein